MIPATTHAVQDSAICAEMVRRHAKTFVAASRFLPAAKRRAANAIYAFCRVADDIVDERQPTPEGAAAAEAALHALRIEFLGAVRGHAQSALSRELGWALRHYDIPTHPFHDLINALRSDLRPMRIARWAELESYCHGVASTVGEMCAYVFGLPDDSTQRAEALSHARTLGVALQLTNILRDVGEDAGRGRCYLPDDDLDACGIHREEILERRISASDPRWHRMMRIQVARARALYVASAPGLALVAPDSRCCASLCAWGYAAILDAIERRAFDTLTGRARVGSARKSMIALRVWASIRLSRPNADVVTSGTQPGLLHPVRRGVRLRVSSR